MQGEATLGQAVAAIGARRAAQAGKSYPRAGKRFPNYLQWPDTGTGIINLNLKGFIVLLVLLSLINVM